MLNKATTMIDVKEQWGWSYKQTDHEIVHEVMRIIHVIGKQLAIAMQGELRVIYHVPNMKSQ